MVLIRVKKTVPHFMLCKELLIVLLANLLFIENFVLGVLFYRYINQLTIWDTLQTLLTR